MPARWFPTMAGIVLLTVGCSGPESGVPADVPPAPTDEAPPASTDATDDPGTNPRPDPGAAGDAALADAPPAEDVTGPRDEAPTDRHAPPDGTPSDADAVPEIVDGGQEPDLPPVPDAPPVDEGPPPFPACPAFAAGERTGWVLHASVTEASGVAASRRNAGVLWVHNDSGGKAEIYGVGTNGTHRGTYVLQGAAARDWEDIAIGPGPAADTRYVYVADIGDNGTSRNDYRLYRVPEPAADGGLIVAVTLDGVEAIEIDYPDGSHNAEAMFVDPWTADVYIVTKRGSGESRVFRAAAPLKTSGSNVMELVTTLRFGSDALPGGTEATAADMSPAGDAIAIRTYDSAFLWRRTPGMTVAEALATAPCPIPVTDQGMGEALGFAADGQGYYTVPEGRMVGIYHFRRQ